MFLSHYLATTIIPKLMSSIFISTPFFIVYLLCIWIPKPHHILFPGFFWMRFVIYTNGIPHDLAVLIIIFQPAFCSKHIYIYVCMYVCIYSILAAVGLLCCEQAFSSCSAWASYDDDFPCREAQALRYMGFSSYGSGLSCSTACGILQDQGSSLCSLHWQADS